MFRGFDEGELLALIEDELDPQRAARLRRRLAAEPDALELIERLRSDRDLLRSAATPETSADLLAELEPMLARPMLMPEAPQWRRSRRRWPAYAAAAVLTLAAGGALWGTVALLRDAGPAWWGGEPQRAAPPVAAAGPTADAPSPSPDAAVHHYAPLPPSRVATAPEPSRPSRTPQPPAAGGERVAADFVLLVQGGPAEVESALVEAMGGLEAGAVVRNVDERHANRILGQAELGPRDRGGGAGGEPLPTGELVWGSRRLAATPQRQVRNSTRGAQYTISLPARQLDHLLEHLALAGRPTALRGAETDAGDATSAALRWLREYRRLRAAVEALPDGAVLELPVLVE